MKEVTLTVIMACILIREEMSSREMKVWFTVWIFHASLNEREMSVGGCYSGYTQSSRERMYQ